MAFGKKYFSSYKSNNNLDYYLELWVENFDSSATEISIGAGGPVISYETDQEDRFSPIISSQCVLPFVVKNTSLQAFIQQLRTTYKERQVYLHLYRATSSTYTTTKPIWSGFLVMDLGSGEDVSFPYEQKLTFVDGLSLLKDIDFVDLSDTSTPAGSTIPLNERIQGNYDRLNMYYGPAVYTFWIKEILAKAGVAISGVDGQGVSIDYGFTTAVNWYNADMQNTNQGSDPLGLTQCVVSMFHNKNDQDVFTPENCYTVLKKLLRHWGARITYWKHEFWIVQIPEYIQDESGLIDNPDNINSRQYNRFGTLTGSQDHLGDTYYTRYEQTIQSNQVSKLVGTKYNYLPMIHNADADFLSYASKNYYGGFPYGVSAESQEIFQGTIIDPSTANFLWLSIPLDWQWDMSGSSLTNGHVGGWWCSIKFNFYASDGTTTYYLQYDSSGQGSYYWVLEADWTPLGNTSPKYVIKSRSLTETNYIGFQQSIPFVDSSGSAISMTGAWSFFLDIEDFANQSSSGVSPGSFFCRFSGYAPSSHYSYVKHDPYQEFPKLPTTGNVSGSGPETKSGKVSWSNTLENPSGITTTSLFGLTPSPVSFDAGTTQADIYLVTTSPFKGLLQTLNTTQSSSFGLSLNTQVNNSTNTEKFSFGTLIWGDAIQQFAVGCLRVNNGTAFVKTNPDGEWGRGTLTGNKTFTELLIDEFLSGQIKVVIAPTMRLAVGEANKNQTATGTGGPATRPRYVNPIGRLRESRTNETDPEYIFRRGSFHSLYDEWDYEGYQILRDTVSATTTTTDIGGLGGAQDNGPISDAKIIPNVTNALMMNSPVAYIRTTVPATGSNVAVNGNFNTAVGWTLGTGWSIDTTAKKAKFAATGSTSELTQSVLSQGLTYQVNFQVVVTAGTLLVKAGTSGTSQSITTSGDYSLYLDCDGSNLIKFQAGTTFTGNITYITLRDQKSISAVPINSIGSTVFKSGDTFNLINSLGGEILPLTVSSNQGATDDTISVTSTALFDDIGIDSVLLINQDDLSAQYQNKTKGTVAGFDITATGIAKSSINITDWLNSDTMSGAAVSNVPTALSVKNYVDGQVGASDTLQEVTDNGNTTTNSIRIGSSTAPNRTLSVYASSSSIVGDIRSASGNNSFLSFSNNASTADQVRIGSSSGNAVIATNYTERLRITSGGFLGIGTTSPTYQIEVNNTSNENIATFYRSNAATAISHIVSTGRPQTRYTYSGYTSWFVGNNTGTFAIGNALLAFSTPAFNISSTGNIGINQVSPTEKLHVVGKGIFTDQVTIPATPVASTDAASKSYVDAQVQATDSLQEVTTVGNTTTNSIMIGSSSSPQELLHLRKSSTPRLLFTDDTTGHTDDDGFFIGLSAGQDLNFWNYENTAIRFATGSTEKMRLTSGGNLLIGTTTDVSAVKLQVNGKTRFGDSTTGIAFGISSTDVYQISGVDVGFSGWNSLHFKADGNDGLFIQKDTNNVGIGTTNPTEKLHVVGDALITGDSHADAFKPAATGEPIKFKNFGSTEVARITDGGNVLIGTTTDNGERLQVDGNARVVTGGNTFLNIHHGNVGFIAFKDNSISAPNEFKIQHNYSQNNDFRISRNTGGTDFVIDNSGNTTLGGSLTGTTATFSGNVGVNGNLLLGTTTDSGEKLQVVNTSVGGDVDGLLLENLTDATNSSVTLTMRASGSSVRNVYLKAINTSGSGEPQDLAFGTNAAYSASTEKMRLTSGGNLLLGTTTDSGDKLEVAGNIKIGDSDILKIGDGNDLQILHNSTESFLHNSTGNLTVKTDTGDIKIRNFANDGDVILETDNGTGGTTPYITLDGSQTTINLQQSVLIGTTTNSGVYKLDVFGKARVQSVFELDDVLTLNQISTPADPASGKSSIYMDSADGAIKCKINVGGTVVTRTIASFE